MELNIKCSGYEIAADWYDGTDENKILIVLPGYSSSKERQRTHAEAMVQDTGTCALAVDFSGHGNSPFELRDTRPAQHFLELIYVFDWAAFNYPQATISVSGSSYGGFLALQLTKYRQFANLILRAPAIYRPEDFYDLWAERIDNLKQYDTSIAEYRRDVNSLAKHPLLRKASAFEGNVLVVVHGEDEIVSRATTDAYIKAFHADSIVAEGLGHTIDKNTIDAATLQNYQGSISDWLNRF